MAMDNFIKEFEQWKIGKEHVTNQLAIGMYFYTKALEWIYNSPFTTIHWDIDEELGREHND